MQNERPSIQRLTSALAEQFDMAVIIFLLSSRIFLVTTTNGHPSSISQGTQAELQLLQCLMHIQVGMPAPFPYLHFLTL